MQRRDQASGVSLEILEHLPPKPEPAYFLLSPTPQTSLGAVPHYLSLKQELAYSSVNNSWVRQCFNLQTPLEVL